MTELDRAELKERERSAWTSVADGWYRRDELLRRGATPVTEKMLQMARIRPGDRVLDIASGTGEPAISAAQLAGPDGAVIGTDLVEEMLAYARKKALDAGLGNIEFRCIDGETLEFAPESFDAVTIRWGLMFMPDPVACLKRAHKVMKTNARIALACWSSLEKSPFFSVIMQTLGNYMDLPKPPPGTPGIFAFADPQRLQGVIESAGFRNIELHELEINVVEVADGRAYWEAISDLAAPIMMLVRQLEDSIRSTFVEELVATVDACKQGDTLCMSGTTWIAAAEK
jgi:ubiquinone/menaquinone biosynthesis C-methylase UbiE